MNEAKEEAAKLPEKPADELPVAESKCRKLLAATTTTPGWLLAMFPLGEDISLVHIQHRNHQLPHFQARFLDGSKHDGKMLGQLEDIFTSLY